MNSCDFGTIPLQTIFENKILENFKNRKNTYENIEGIITNEMENKTNDELMTNVSFNLTKQNTLKLDDINIKNLNLNVNILDDKLEKQNTLYNVDIENNAMNTKNENKKKKSNKDKNKNKIEQKKRKISDENSNKNKNNNTINNNENEDYVKIYKMSDKYFSGEYWDEKLEINFKINNDYDMGKLEIYKRNILDKEIIDHNDKIIDFFYNRRLNMFATCSYDGIICIYVLPYKLISIIKNENNTFFDRIFLSSNPFPSIITFEKKRNMLSSYSISGLLIKEIVVEEKIDVKIDIFPILNIYGGNIKDQVKVSICTDQNITNQIYSLPLFEQESEEFLIKNNTK